MKVLVTGATGFIGGHLARHAVSLGCEVAGLGGAALLCPEDLARSGLAWHRPGPIDMAALASLPFRPDLVLHCAGGASVAASVSDPALDRRRTVETTELLVRHIVENAPQARLVYPSSGAVYGAHAAILPRDCLQPAAPLSPYGQHKAEAEAVIRAASIQNGLKAAIVRLFSIFGPGLRKQLLWDACERFRAGHAEFGGSGAELRDFLAVEDAVSLLWQAGEHAGSGCPLVDGGTGTGTAVFEVLTLLAGHFKPRPVIRFSRVARTGDPFDMVADIRAATALNWRPAIGLAHGVAAYAKWFKQAVGDHPPAAG
ncbi:NAD(P)-dependent oxidoreductase [Bosea sp. AAP35]|uniref:NAD-dependent epimerase/dehydratase family protein n=1 Tax=Bosea sp. AAP35 TaxID=1523417 RepID=UPI0018D14AE8|nr:NAD(P)-dependent oxidoreductase [Bosea sp. AAP35]